MLVVNCSRVSRVSLWSSRAMAEVVSGDMKCRATAFSVPTRARKSSNPHEYWGLDGLQNNDEDRRWGKFLMSL